MLVMTKKIRICRKTFIKPLEYQKLQDIESEIKRKVCIKILTFIDKDTRYDEEFVNVKELLSVRQELLDEMFLATPEEINRLEHVNSLLDDSTKKMFRRTSSLYRALMSSCRDENLMMIMKSWAR